MGHSLFTGFLIGFHLLGQAYGLVEVEEHHLLRDLGVAGGAVDGEYIVIMCQNTDDADIDALEDQIRTKNQDELQPGWKGHVKV